MGLYSSMKTSNKLETEGIWLDLTHTRIYKLPDMSRIFPKLMPAKRLTPQTMTDLPRMIEETCVAELIHALLSVSGLGFLWLWPGGWGIALTVVYILLGNVSFIIIQRYNRPRLVKLLEMQQKKAARTKKEDAECGR